VNTFSLICADLSASISMKSSFSFLADLRGFSLIYANFQCSFICVHLREIFFFLADLRGFYLLYAIFLRSFICVHLREIFFFLADLR